MSKILNSQLLIYPGSFLNAAQGVNSIGSNAYFKGELAEKLLLYDRVIIPTFDFSIMPVLLAWLGNKNLEELLDDGSISFVRHMGFIGYFGGDGPVIFAAKKQDDVSPRENWVKAAFADTGSAIDAWINTAKVKPEPKQRQRIIDKSINYTKTIQLNSEDSKRILREETYKDILESSLKEYFGDDTQFDNLPGINKDQIRITNLYNPQQHDEIDFLLTIAFTNFEIYMAHIAEEADLTSSFDIDFLLRAKVERLLRKVEPHTRAMQATQGFSEIIYLEKMPNIGPAVTAGELGFSEIIKIRRKNNAVKFRNWFHLNVARKPEEASREYISAISRRNLTDRLETKIIRFVITSVAGLVPILGITVSFVDSFIVNKFLKGYSPKFFIDELRAKLPKSKRDLH